MTRSKLVISVLTIAGISIILGTMVGDRKYVSSKVENNNIEYSTELGTAENTKPFDYTNYNVYTPEAYEEEINQYKANVGTSIKEGKITEDEAKQVIAKMEDNLKKLKKDNSQGKFSIYTTKEDEDDNSSMMSKKDLTNVEVETCRN